MAQSSRSFTWEPISEWLVDEAYKHHNEIKRNVALAATFLLLLVSVLMIDGRN